MNNRITFAVVFSVLLGAASAPAGLGSKRVEPAQRYEVKKNPLRYYCVMDPEVSSNKPGLCPKCGMTLRLAK